MDKVVQIEEATYVLVKELAGFLKISVRRFINEMLKKIVIEGRYSEEVVGIYVSFELARRCKDFNIYRFSGDQIEEFKRIEGMKIREEFLKDRIDAKV